MKSRRTRREFLGQAGVAIAAALVPNTEGHAAGAARAGVVLDVTGNWQAGDEPQGKIQTREPRLKAGEKKTFSQTVVLPTGPWAVEFEYDPERDTKEFATLGGSSAGFSGIRVDNQPLQADFKKTGTRYLARCVPAARRRPGPARLDLTLANTRPLQTRISLGAERGWGSPYHALPPAEPGEFLLVQGIPFHLRRLCFFESFIDTTHSGKDLGLDRGSLLSHRDGVELACSGARVKTAYFLGMIHNLDLANGSWYSRKGDHGYSHFVGDQAGEISIRWEEGGTATVPLVFGSNLWFSRPWDIFWFYRMYGTVSEEANSDAKLFAGRDEPRRLIADSLRLEDGVRAIGSLSCNARFVFSLDLEGRSVASIDIKGHPQMHDYPLISAVTLETAEPCPALPSLPDVSTEKPRARPISLATAAPGDGLAGVEKIKRLFYSFVDELPTLTKPEIPEGYFGPHYDFEGPREAAYAATYLYRNGPECATHIADTGTGCSSKTAHMALAHYHFGMGTWVTVEPLFQSLQHWFGLYANSAPGTMPGLGQAWSRAVGELLREAMAFGYDKFVNTYVDWLDQRLFSDGNPPHWIRVVGYPDPSLGTKIVKVGDVEERGNRENDGHGICMWGRYMLWHWLGRPRAWNERRFAATRAAVEWIQWQLDTDTLRPGARKDVLYTESECAPGGYDIYSTYNCLHGIKLSIRMAEQLGQTEIAARWKDLYVRLRQGILDHLVDQTAEGPIWRTHKACDWQDHAHRLIHLHLATEGDTYTPLQDYAAGDESERDYLQISRNSYRGLLKDKNYDYLRMFGYGQGMMTQAALLLDEMEDATKFLDMMLTHCYLPRMEGWTGPEGIIVHRSGKYYLPVNGYMGQDSHVADSTKALRLMLGVDDNQPDHLRLVPRYPASWTSMSIKDFPALTGASRQRIAYRYERSSTGHRFHFEFEQPVARFSIRLGPVPRGKKLLRASRDGDQALPCEVVDSGDSRWVWLRNQQGQSGTVTVDWS